MGFTSRSSRQLAVLLAIALLAPACTGRTKTSTATAAKGDRPLVNVTKAGTKPVDNVNWAVYREVNSVDPNVAFDYPENTVLANLCEGLLTQGADGAIGKGLAELTQPNATTLVFKLRAGVKFWNGDPVTAEDVVFSLKRSANPEGGGFYSLAYIRVKSIDATDATTVTITLNEPDYWLQGELASPAGFIIQKKFTEAAGTDFGNPTGRVMCTGSYKLGSWKVGEKLVIERNDAYWNTTIKPKVAKISFSGVPDNNALTAGLISGDIDGVYAFTGVSTIEQLKSNKAVTVTEGSGWNTELLVVSSYEGALASVDARQALSKAVDRQAYINAAYKGLATVPRSLSSPGTWGYAADTFAAAHKALPVMNQDLAEAKKLAEKAGVVGKTITIGVATEIESQLAQANAYKTAAEAIGMKLEFKTVSADQFINFFIDPEFRKGIDGFLTVNYGDYADPTAFLQTIVSDKGSQNFGDYKTESVRKLMEEARSTSDPKARAEKVLEAQKIITAELPWIPTTYPSTLLITSSKISGANASFSYMFSPWANDLGGV